MAEPIFDMAAAIKRRIPDADPDLAMVIIAVARLGRLLEWDLQRTAHLGGLERSEHSVLTILWLAGPDHPQSPTQLSEIIIQTTSGMSKTLRRLERVGLVERIPDPSDGRGQLIRLTKAGSRRIEGHTRQMFERWEARLDSFPHSEWSRLADTIWALLTLAEESFLNRKTLLRNPNHPTGQQSTGYARRKKTS
jgi:DNA-binding MarR family transcriptional regulator